MDNWIVEITLLNFAGESESDVAAEGLRQQVWGAIGEGTGRAMGEFLGTGMDALILNLEDIFGPKSK